MAVSQAQISGIGPIIVGLRSEGIEYLRPPKSRVIRLSMRSPAIKNNTEILQSFWFWASAITLLRIIVLVVSDANLGPDEAQYWFWSRDLDFGYFSKPPLIAWAIAMTTALFGNDEWAVRLAAPLFHLGAGAFLYLTAKAQFTQRTAFWAGLGWLTMPGVILSSFVITTDAPLLFFWSGALYFLYKIAASETGKRQDYAGLGAMIGFGLLSKYAMLYFIAALAISAVLARPIRKAALQRGALITLIIAAGIATPNILWNAQNDFQTLSHTAANANWDSTLFQPMQLVIFFIEQFAIAGIVPFAVLVIVVTGWRSQRPDWKITTALIFALTPLLIVSMQAFISRAHANWAAAAYPSAMLLITVWLLQHRATPFLRASLGLHAFVFIGFCVAITNFSLIDRAGFSPAVKDIRGWQAQGANIVAKAEGFDAIVIDDRPLMGAMLYYHGKAGVDIVAIDPNNHIDNHYEAFKAFNPDKHKRVLFVTTLTDDAHVNYRFRTIHPLGPETVSFGPGVSRTYHLFDISDYYNHLNK